MPRIRIKKLPQASYGLQMGDQNGYGLHIADQSSPTSDSQNSSGVRTTLPLMPRDQANIEAEKNETVVGDFDNDGYNEHSLVGGKPHYAGGANISVPEGSFIFSNNRRLGIGGKMLLEFGKNPDGTKKFTPAQIAKQYNLTEHKQTLENPGSDYFDKQTAALMYENNQSKLGKLAFLQEAMKGFPTGIPDLAKNVLNPRELPVAKFGGPIKAAYGLENPNPVKPYKGSSPRKYQQARLNLQNKFNEYNTPWLSKLGYENSVTGFNKALADAGYKGEITDNTEIQKYLIRGNLLRGNTTLFDYLLTKYGLTNRGINAGLPETTDAVSDPQTLENIFADGYFGVRSGLMLKDLIENNLKFSRPSVKTIPYKYGTPKININRPIGNYLSNTPKTNTVVKNKLPIEKEEIAEDDPNGWWLQDIINTGAAGINRWNIKSYKPALVKGPAVYPEVSFYDPTRQIAASQEQAAQQNMIAAMFADPQKVRAITSNIQGQSVPGIADALAKTEAMNVGVNNQAEAENANISNQKIGRDLAATKQYMDEFTTLHQQRDNSIREANESFRNNLIGGITNSQRTSWLDTPQFHMDPTRAKVIFKNGKKRLARSSGGDESGYLNQYKAIYDRFLAKMNNEDRAHDFAQKILFGNKTRLQADNDGDSSVSTTGYENYPAAMQLLGMYAPHFLGR